MIRVPTLCIQPRPSPSTPTNLKYARAAEVINARAAMSGAVACVGNCALTGHNILTQVEDPLTALGATSLTALVALGSFWTMGDRLEPPSEDSVDLTTGWTPSAEILNGRVAMMGMAGLVSAAAVSSM